MSRSKLREKVFQLLFRIAFGSEEEYEESESNSSSETAHESNHIKRHKNKTVLDKLLSLVTNCCGTREKHIEDDNFNTVNVSSCDSDTK